MIKAAVTLNTGNLMPIIGLGTFQLKGKETIYPAIDAALKSGYRLIDTAAGYKNEAEIGDCLRELLPKYGLTREDVFITSKLAPIDQGAKAYSAVEGSLSRLGFDWLDLFIIHWPGTQKLKHDDPQNKENRKQSWISLEKLHKEGKLRNIGVSNYFESHIEDLMTYAAITPAVNQVEHHPYMQNQSLLKLCKTHGIHLQAYSSLGVGKLLDEPVIDDIAEKYQKKSHHILLRWAVENEISVIPKSSKPERIVDNFQIWDFQLTEEDKLKIKDLEKGHQFTWDPSTVI